MEGLKMLNAWRSDPVLFVKEVFDCQPDPKQVEALIAFAQSKFVCVKGARGSGKTILLSWCAWWYLICNQNSQVLVPVGIGKGIDDLRDTMLFQHHCSDLLYKIFEKTQNMFRAIGSEDTWFCQFRKIDQNNPVNTLAGMCGDNILYIVDKADQFDKRMIIPAEAGTDFIDNGKLLVAGYPYTNDRIIAHACANQDKWKVISITGDPESPERSPRIPKQWAEQQIEMYGRESPWVKANVFAEFPISENKV